MRVQDHGNNLIQLTYYGFVNVYLLREDDGFTLIDTALEGCAKSIVQVARQFGQPIVRILLTHAHADHSGGLDAVHALVPDAEFVMPARDARFLSGDMSLDAGEPQDRLRGGWVIRKAAPARLVQEGERVGSLEVIATPGHSPGHCSFLDLRDRTIIAGDAFQTMGGVAVSGTFKLLFPLVYYATWRVPASCAPLSRAARQSAMVAFLKSRWPLWTAPLPRRPGTWESRNRELRPWPISKRGWIL